jgi:Large eukaryotic DNA virus major capsid protein/Major capsid protein N-terminus
MSKEPLGGITTLLDLTDRDAQENYLFPLEAKQSWFTRDTQRKLISFAPNIQTTLFRGPADFGQRFMFDLGSLRNGDLLFGAFLEIKLGHWLDTTTLNGLAGGTWTYVNPITDGWEYANSLGTACIAQAELEIDGKTVETIDGDFADVFGNVFPDYNCEVGVAYDHAGKIPRQTLRNLSAPRNFPTEDGVLHCPLPFFFGRVKYQEALHLIGSKEGTVRIFITLRPFSEVVRRMSGARNSCDETPLNRTIQFNTPTGITVVKTATVAPALESVSLLTHGALVDGEYRQMLLRQPFEFIHREIQTFTFDEPQKYQIMRNSTADTVTIQFPLEANHPIEEILWFVRRKNVRVNNEWTNYTNRLESEWPINPVEQFITAPILQNAKLQVNGIPLIEADEQYFRRHIAYKHKGGFASYANYMYGLSFAERPGHHQPSGSINASRANSLRLTLEIRNPGGNVVEQDWEVKVFCVALNWLRCENGLTNAVFED